MQGVVVHIVQLHVMPNIAPSPIDQGVDLCPTLGGEFRLIHQPDLRPGVGLLPSEARDPCPLSLKGLAQGFEFSDFATRLSVLQGAVNGTLPFVLNKLNDVFMLGFVDLNFEARRSLCSLQERQGLVVQSASF